ncbi:MAG: DUF72 domain-containing protein [Planctomycetes bacterium]|nr:DUF72 domain-containing protein [Planctomycetota bacterium]
MIRVGPAGWSYADWEGVVYPRRKPRGFHALAYLAEHFDLVEINSSFYSLPRDGSAERWAELVVPHANFRFTAKLHREFTHDARVDAARVREFRASLEPLVRHRRLAAWLAQFPWSFAFGVERLELLKRLSEAFRDAPLVLELRHATWFEPAATDALLAVDVSLAEIDLPRSSTAPPVHVAARGQVGYLRLHGRNTRAWFDREATRDQKYDYLYDDREVESFASRATELDREHADTLVVTNNHFSGKAVTNALELAAAITRAKRRVPEPLLAAYPRLERIALPAPRRGLFD